MILTSQKQFWITLIRIALLILLLVHLKGMLLRGESFCVCEWFISLFKAKTKFSWNGHSGSLKV